MYFRGDEEFYAELDQKLTEARKKEVNVLHGKEPARRALTLFVHERPRLKQAWDWFRDNSRPARKLLKSKLGINVTDAV